VGFLLLLTSTIGMFPSSVYANEAIDSDGDGIPDDLDQCPHLLEDYDTQYGNNIDGCPADFVPWYDADYDGMPSPSVSAVNLLSAIKSGQPSSSWNLL